MLFLQIFLPIYLLFFIFMGIASLRSGSSYIKNLHLQGKKANLTHNFEFTKGIFFLLVSIGFLPIFIMTFLPTDPLTAGIGNMPLAGLAAGLIGAIFILMGVQLPYLSYLALYKQSEEVGEEAKKWEKAPLSAYRMIGAGLILMGLAVVWIGIFLAFFMMQIGTNLGLFAGLPLFLIGLACVLVFCAFILYLRAKARNTQRKLAGEQQAK